jgi:hypothetical protein
MMCLSVSVRLRVDVTTIIDSGARKPHGAHETAKSSALELKLPRASGCASLCTSQIPQDPWSFLLKINCYCERAVSTLSPRLIRKSGFLAALAATRYGTTRGTRNRN